MGLQELDVKEMLRLVADAGAASPGYARRQCLLGGVVSLVQATTCVTARFSTNATQGEISLLSAWALIEGEPVVPLGQPSESSMRAAAAGDQPASPAQRLEPALFSRPGLASLAEEFVLRQVGSAATRQMLEAGVASRLADVCAHHPSDGSADRFTCSAWSASDDGLFHLVQVYRNSQGKPFTVREEQILHFMRDPIERLCHGLAESAPQWIRDLPPHLRRLLPELLAGDGEKQIAAKLGFTVNTVHQYIKSIYRRCGVSSRAEFMARCLSSASPAEFWDR